MEIQMASTEEITENKLPRHVLVVDDNEAVRVTLKDLLETLDYTVEVACDGEEGLEKVKASSFDIVLTDIQMPKMPGTELLNHIKDYNPLIPVVMITGYPSLDIAVEAMKKGASDFITKPFKMAYIENVLKKLIRERQLMEENATLRIEVAQKRTIERLNYKLNHQVKELGALYTISEGIRGNEEPEEVFEKLVDLGLKITEAEKATLFLLDQESTQLHVKTSRGGSANMQLDLLHEVLHNGFSEEIFKAKRPILINHQNKSSGPELNALSLKAHPSALIVPLIIKGEVFGLLTIQQKTTGEDFNQEDLCFLNSLAEKATLSIENNALYDSIYGNLLGTLRTLINTIEAKDNYTKAHSQRVTQYATSIAYHMGLAEEQIEIIRFAGFLHDIGKIGIRDTILLKTDSLTDEEYDIIKAHPVIGESIISPLGFLPQEREIIKYHHERWDGKGYPDGLSGEKIPFLARIVAVADAFDAITSDRPYRKSKSTQEAIEELRLGINSHFDGVPVNAFISCLENKSISPKNGFLSSPQ